jgi:hypothetical protein
MLTANAAPQQGNYDKSYAAAIFDADVLKKAKNLFEEYHRNGIILNGNFSDSEWHLTNQLHNLTIGFRFDEVGYYKNAKPWIGCKYESFVDCVKAYMMFTLGSLTILTIREIVHSFRLFTALPQTQLIGFTSEHVSHMAAFIAVLPGENAMRDAVIEALEEKQLYAPRQTGMTRQRVLSGLGTYFKFNDAMQDLWVSVSDKEKLFWFPLYLWWTVTAILPLRTTEFLLTPRECLSTQNGKTLISLRRTLLKGGGRRLSYRVDKDYEIVQYTIPDKMAADISWYLSATADMTPSSLSTLLVQQPHYARFSKMPNSSLGYYTYANLSTCLRHFLADVMGVNEDSKIHLGDTRHLAMISLILSGGSPLICKELAGHADINVSSHYYSNISSFIESAVFDAHRKNRVWMAELTERPLSLPTIPRQGIPVQHGFCDSKAYSHGEISDCIKAIGTGGELGDCRRCPHFIDGKSGVHLLYGNPLERKAQVDGDSHYLLQTIEAVRRGIGLHEDIQSALLRLQQSCSWYGRSLFDELEGNFHGKTTKTDK